MATNLPFKGTPDIHSKEIYLDVEPPLVNLTWGRGRGWGIAATTSKVRQNCSTTAEQLQLPQEVYRVRVVGVLPTLLRGSSEPFSVTEVDFAWPFLYESGKKE